MSDLPTPDYAYQERPDVLTWLQGWFAVHCNGDWEHDWRIKIENLDNPGWSVSINVENTELAAASFEPRKVNRSEDDWLFARIERGWWKLSCGPLNLAEGLHHFRAWASGFGNPD